MSETDAEIIQHVRLMDTPTDADPRRRYTEAQLEMAIRLARRGAAMQMAQDDQFARIQRLETALQDLAEIALKLEKERDSLKAERKTVGHLDNVETAALRAALKLKIDEQQFLAAVDREGDHEVGAGKLPDDLLPPRRKEQTNE